MRGMQIGCAFGMLRSRLHPAVCRAFSSALITGVIWSCCGLTIQAQPDAHVYQIGLARSIFRHRNENDMLAAMKVWAQTIANKSRIRVNPDLHVYRSTQQAVDAVREKSVDAVAMSLVEYAAFPEGLLSGPYFRDASRGSTHVEFVLLTRSDGGLRKLEDLRNTKLTVHDGMYYPLGKYWLDALLAASGIGSAMDAVSRVETNTKLSAVVLSVFFGKSDACLVARQGFESMAALNPQVSTQLSVMATSPPIVPQLFCFRSDFGDADKEQFFKEIARLHESATGQQVLQVFKSDRVSEITTEQLDRSLQLLSQWSRELPAKSESPAKEGGDSKLLVPRSPSELEGK